MIHRLPTGELLRPYVNLILTTMLKVLQTDNEENVLICLRIIIELHKQFRPAFTPEVQLFLSFVKQMYADLPKHLPKIFEPRASLRIHDMTEVNLEQLLSETYTVTQIQVEKKPGENEATNYSLIPRGTLSLKVFQELPIIVVLMYQIYKQYVHQEVAGFVPLIMVTITLQPAAMHRAQPSVSRELFVDFMGAQIKTLSFLAYVIRIFQDEISNHGPSMVKGVISLLQSCPKEVTNLRKELLIAVRHILATELRTKFVGSIETFFDEELLLGQGYTCQESLKPLAYSTLADLVHHVRQHLNIHVLTKASYLFAKNVHDEAMPTSIQTMSCKLLLNLVDCIRQRSDPNTTTARDLLIMLLRVFTKKFYTIAKVHLPLILAKAKSASGELREPQPAELNATEQIEKLASIGYAQPPNLSLSEFRSLIKTLVCGVKTVTWGLASCKAPNVEAAVAGQQSKMFNSEEIEIFIDLVYWGMEALDIYTINPSGNGASSSQVAKTSGQQLPVPRSKEEKEVLEHYSGVVSILQIRSIHQTTSIIQIV